MENIKIRLKVHLIAYSCIIIVDKLYLYKKKSIVMHYQDLIETIKERRQGMRVTQEMLAEISGVGLRTLKQFESGKGNPTLATLVKLLDVLGLEIILQVKKELNNEKRQSFV
ncbi:helix-turn-helix domain-containing protein [Labilibaculum euxinus]